MFIGTRLVFDKYMDVTVAGGGFQAVEDVAEILAEIILNERAGFQFQRGKVADSAQLGRQMDLHKIPGNLRLGQELPERGVVGRWRVAFLFHQPWL